jgi:hypothetical protein
MLYAIVAVWPFVDESDTEPVSESPVDVAVGEAAALEAAGEGGAPDAEQPDAISAKAAAKIAADVPRRISCPQT